jgi:hypothetical protein
MREKSEMNLRESAQQALEALELAQTDVHWELNSPTRKFLRKAEKNLRAALAEEAMQRLTDTQQEIQATCQESRQVEPVAYVTGYNKGRCIIESVDPDWLMPVGMALYRSPPTISKTETVEPVAWLIESCDIYAKRTLQRLVFDNPKNMQGVKITAYYAAPPQRKPLTEEEITQCWQRMGGGFDKYMAFARAIERAHGIGGEE